MKVRLYKLRRSIEDGQYVNKYCWLDNISLYKGDQITIDSCPDWMWWDVAEVYDPIEEAEIVTNLKPGNLSEEDIGPYWIPM